MPGGRRAGAQAGRRRTVLAVERDFAGEQIVAVGIGAFLREDELPGFGDEGAGQCAGLGQGGVGEVGERDQVGEVLRVHDGRGSRRRRRDSTAMPS
ncbi:hypothetical protein SDC9_174037 [bioreactor metagenome]|uniref:Uncharacterized protein n=1 Tax=bioreactor metagenome TaxID=1076179 RepID=A0A645GL61_9ZZZZ